jgi:hypothetical protein
LPTSIEFSASITVPTALGAPRFAQRTAVTIPDTVAVVTIVIKAARMTGVMDAVRSLTSKVRPLGVVRIEFQEQKWSRGFRETMVYPKTNAKLMELTQAPVGRELGVKHQFLG